MNRRGYKDEKEKMERKKKRKMLKYEIKVTGRYTEIST
jgi:hypothetical protein